MYWAKRRRYEESFKSRRKIKGGIRVDKFKTNPRYPNVLGRRTFGRERYLSKSFNIRLIVRVTKRVGSNNTITALNVLYIAKPFYTKYCQITIVYIYIYACILFTGRTGLCFQAGPCTFPVFQFKNLLFLMGLDLILYGGRWYHVLLISPGQLLLLIQHLDVLFLQ